MANDTQGYMAPEEKNRLLGYLYVGHTFETYVNEQAPADEETARKFWDDTVQWMQDNPLKPGEVWGTVPE